MTIKVAINGYGRIGRNILRAIYESGRETELQVVAINDLGDADSNAHLTQYDTAHGKFPGEVSAEGDHLVVDGHKIRVLSERDPANLPWGELGVDAAHVNVDGEAEVLDDRTQLLRRDLACPVGVATQRDEGVHCRGVQRAAG